MLELSRRWKVSPISILRDLSGTLFNLLCENKRDELDQLQRDFAAQEFAGSGFLQRIATSLGK